MDKQLTRQIGFIKAKTYSEKKPATQTPVKENKIEISPPIGVVDTISDSERIRKWILEHKAFKFATMCADLGIDKSNFHRILKSQSGSFNEKNIEPIKKYLANYGY